MGGPSGLGVSQRQGRADEHQLEAPRRQGGPGHGV